MTVRMVPISELVIDLREETTLYPRNKVDPKHERDLARMLGLGIVLPPILVDERTKRVVDGVHRVGAHRLQGRLEIAADVKDYADERAMFVEAMTIGSDDKLALNSSDKVRCCQIAERLGIEDTTLAQALALSFSHLRAIKQRYATVQEAQQAVAEARRVEPVEVPIEELRRVPPAPPGTSVSSLRRVPLKASTRHLSGRTITLEQAHALETAPGQSYLLHVRQLLDALAYDLLPSEEQHPTLWAELRELRDRLTARLS